MNDLYEISEDLTEIIPNPENLTWEEKKTLLENQYKRQMIGRWGWGMEDSRLTSSDKLRGE